MEVARWGELSQGLAQQIFDLKHNSEALKMKNKELLDILRQQNIYVKSSDSYI